MHTNMRKRIRVLVESGDTNDKSPLVLCLSCSDRRCGLVSPVFSVDHTSETDGVSEQDILFK